MDDETRALLDTIITGKRDKYASRVRDPRKPTMEETMHKIAESVAARERFSKPSHTDPFKLDEAMTGRDPVMLMGKPASYHETPRNTFYVDVPLSDNNTLGKVAVVCVNTAKACIVLRADISYQVAKDLQAITKGQDITYNKKDNVVEFHPRWLPEIKKVLAASYQHVSVLAAQKAVKPTKFDLLLSKLSTDDKKSMYSLLAKRYHPDLPHGNKDIMTLVNLVFKGGD